MTVNYHKEVMSSHPWTIIRLLFTWKASVWKAVLPDLCVWLIAYAILSVIYRSVLDDYQKTTFERVALFLENRLNYIPLDLILGFYVSSTVDRWTYRYRRIGFIDNVCLMVAEYVRGHNEEGRKLRRTIIRYTQLGEILVFRDISMRTRRRFPTLDSVVAAGFMTETEKIEYESYHNNFNKQWIPFNWAYSLVYEARKRGHIEHDLYVQTVLEDIRTFRTDLENCNNYDWTPLPLLYLHVVCLVVHFYFIVAVIARQFIISPDALNKTSVDIYFPVMTVIQFVFYVGWLKTGETMMNPFGEDDDDWETNALIDRNITMAMAIVDPAFDRPPEMMKDMWWDDEVIEPLYADSGLDDNGDGEKGMRGSASTMKLKTDDVKMVPLGGWKRKTGAPKVPTKTIRIADVDRPLPKRPSILSLDGLRNIFQHGQKTPHYEFNPDGAGTITRHVEEGKVVGKRVPKGIKEEVDDRLKAAANELSFDDDFSPPSSPIFIISSDAHLPLPSTPIEEPFYEHLHVPDRPSVPGHLIDRPTMSHPNLAMSVSLPARTPVEDEGKPLPKDSLSSIDLQEIATLRTQNKLPKNYDLPSGPL